jgi:hypothetical protein
MSTEKEFVLRHYPEAIATEDGHGHSITNGDDIMAHGHAENYEAWREAENSITIDPEDRAQAKKLIDAWHRASEGNSGDAEHDASFEVVDFLGKLVGMALWVPLKSS